MASLCFWHIMLYEHVGNIKQINHSYIKGQWFIMFGPDQFHKITGASINTLCNHVTLYNKGYMVQIVWCRSTWHEFLNKPIMYGVVYLLYGVRISNSVIKVLVHMAIYFPLHWMTLNSCNQISSQAVCMRPCIPPLSCNQKHRPRWGVHHV